MVRLQLQLKNPLQKIFRKLIHYLKQKMMKVKCPPLLNTDRHHIVFDELHLMMKIIDVRNKNLIENAINLDQRENIGAKLKVKRHETAIVEVIQSCGVSFSVWESTTTRDGKGDSFSKSLEWISLTWSDMKKTII